MDETANPDAPELAASPAEPAGYSLGAVFGILLISALSLGGLWLAKLQLDFRNQPSIEQLHLELTKAVPGKPNSHILVVRNDSAGTFYCQGYGRESLIVSFQFKQSGQWKSQMLGMCGTGLKQIAIAPGQTLRVPCSPYNGPKGAKKK